ncbi:ATP-binding protein [Paenibacillus aurantius]|uniref:ATP-binding protein n=1 Tax=Paenibacillus aurantius TaxID=2918900 RepID=A0AA96LCL9_9BACL|nr:ATP-binding protein [Paenibacillus aurantius]WNQ11469.1 ATP-binding protein [Paenibacillus aurantius]
MARADLLLDIIKYGLHGDMPNLRRATEAVCAEERAKQHNVLVNRIEELLNSSRSNPNNSQMGPSVGKNGSIEQSLFTEITPRKRLEHLILPQNVYSLCRELIEEQNRADLLRSYGLEPRNRILLNGPPGNGKTSVAEAIAEALMIPLLTVKYETIVGAYLGETANRLAKLIDQAKRRQCVLFFDEFETLGKERGDVHETGEIKRVVSSLLLHIDSLPSYVIVVGATNHENLLDKAAWRRFQLHLELPTPSRDSLEKWFVDFEKRTGFKLGLAPSTLAKKCLGYSFAEAEELARSIQRQYILQLPNENIVEVSTKVVKLWESQKRVNNGDM